MTYVALDDQVTEHPSMVGLSPFGWTMWIHGLTYAARNLTDGHIPQAMLPRLTSLAHPERAVTELVDAGRWTVSGDGWLIEGYLDWNKSRAQIEQEKAAAADRQRRYRDGKRDASRDALVTRPSTAATAAVDTPPTPPARGGADPLDDFLPAAHPPVEATA